MVFFCFLFGWDKFLRGFGILVRFSLHALVYVCAGECEAMCVMELEFKHCLLSGIYAGVKQRLAR